ncbi:lamin tail domain-containing protein, partial [Candidatus Latescibacterota bacterium]
MITMGKISLTLTKTIFILLIIITPGYAEQPTPLINEIMSSSASTIEDEYGDYSDWIELYNPGVSSIDLSGYGLSDRPDNPYKWIFPNCFIFPGEHKLIFTSGKDRIDDSNLHTNFRISATGETITLTDAAGNVCDQVDTGYIPKNISRGRNPDGGAEWVFFEQLTPGESNSTQGFETFADDVVISPDGGFFNVQQTVELTAQSESCIIRY